jgi:hypothetical protein
MWLARSKYWAFACAGVLAACGGHSTSRGDHSGSSGSGGSGAGGTGSGSGGKGTAGGKCAAFEDEAGWEMVVRFTNRTSRVIHLGQQQVNCSFDPLFRVMDDTGPELVTSVDCPTTCSALRTSGPMGACHGICAYPLAISLAPQESFDLSWDGRHWFSTMMPLACLADPAQSACVQARHVLPSLHTFWAEAGTTLDCANTIGTCGECLPRQEGGCTTQAAVIGGQILTAKVQLKLDSGYGVGTIGGAVPLPIELVFND